MTGGRFQAASANKVRVYVACYRLDGVGTDMVLSLNAPVEIVATSSSAETETVIMDPTAALADFRALSDSVVVRDMSLFGG